MKKEFEKFTISQVAVLIRDNKCLILEFARSPGKWGLPGGRIDKGEMGEEAFRREIKEELNLSCFEIVDIVDLDIWYTPNGRAVSAPAFLIQNDSDKIVLSNEHTSMEWVTEDRLDDYDFLWPNAKRMLKSGFRRNKL